MVVKEVVNSLTAIDHKWEGYEKLIKNNHLGIFWLIRKRLFDKIGGFEVISCEDYDFAIRAAESGAVFYHLPKVLAHYSVHAKMSTKNITLEGLSDMIRVRAAFRPKNKIKIPIKI
jgi:GT2 family glycosyltransferase